MDASFWSELIAIDRFRVKSQGELHDWDRKLLTSLYQPLVGIKAFGLYMTLWSELDRNRSWSEEQTHHALMSSTQLSMPEIFQERQKLEGIGLLNTYIKKEGELRTFIYELVPPLAARDFFDDSLLNIFLYNQLGKSQYTRVKHYFLTSTIDTKEYRKITRPFSDIFTSLTPEKIARVMSGESQKDFVIHKGQEVLYRSEGTNPQLLNREFNYQLFADSLSHHLVKPGTITDSVREVIIKLAYLYHVDPLSMSRLVLGAINHEDRLDIEKLKKDTRDWYLLMYGETIPTVVETETLKKEETKPKKNLTPEERMLEQFEKMDPAEWLRALSNGAEPTKSDLKIIEDLMIKQKLPAPVVNVLIDFVMLRNNKKLTKGYVEKIGSHWARKGVRTAKEAMELAKSEHKQYTQWGQKTTKSTSSGTTTSRKKSIRTEQVPDWFEQMKEEEQVKKKKQVEEDDFDVEAARRALEEELKQFKKE